MADKLDALPSGSLVLVTGANGYIASNIIDHLLHLGFKVRGTIRASKPWLDGLFQSKYNHEAFESVIVPSLEEEHSVKLAMQGVAGVVHVVSGKQLFVTLQSMKLSFRYLQYRLAMSLSKRTLPLCSPRP